MIHTLHLLVCESAKQLVQEIVSQPPNKIGIVLAFKIEKRYLNPLTEMGKKLENSSYDGLFQILLEMYGEIKNDHQLHQNYLNRPIVPDRDSQHPEEPNDVVMDYLTEDHMSEESKKHVKTMLGLFLTNIDSMDQGKGKYVSGLPLLEETEFLSFGDKGFKIRVLMKTVVQNIPDVEMEDIQVMLVNPLAYLFTKNVFKDDDPNFPKPLSGIFSDPPRDCNENQIRLHTYLGCIEKEFQMHNFFAFSKEEIKDDCIVYFRLTIIPEDTKGQARMEYSEFLLRDLVASIFNQLNFDIVENDRLLTK